MFHLRPHQREDHALLAMHDGGIYAAEPGTGKTMAIFTLPFLKGAANNLIVAPADLHDQIIKEGREKFKVHVTTIRTQADALDLIRRGILPNPHRQPGQPGPSSTPHSALPTPHSAAQPQHFITDYRWLGYNGGDEWDTPPSKPVLKRRLATIARLHPAATEQQLTTYQSGIGTSSTPHSALPTPHSIQCVFTPTLSSLIGDCFDCVICDEGVALKSGEAHQSLGVLNLRPRFAYVLTGTPIKNRLPDIFFLASWVSGYSPVPTARWPYGNTLAERKAFAAKHLVLATNLTKQQQLSRTGHRRSSVKQTNKITNLHELWKLLDPIVVRRRKDSIPGLVAKTLCPIRVLPGTAQRAAYQRALDHPTVHASHLATLGAQLQSLRSAALCPWAPSSSTPHSALPTPHFTPKVLACLQLAADLMEKGEQLTVFSPFTAFSTALHAAFQDAGVNSLLLDGRTSPADRARLASDFKAGKHPVLIAGIKAMGRGHSFECASHLVLPSLDQAYDENAQAIDRVHRLTSRKDVTIYILITIGTIDERLFASFQEKGNASDLALDARLHADDRQEVTLTELLQSAAMDFDPAAPTLDENIIHHQWTTQLRPRLQAAAQANNQVAAGVSPQAVAGSSRPAPSNIIPIRRTKLTPAALQSITDAFS